jgi:hypothetical protein
LFAETALHCIISPVLCPKLRNINLELMNFPSNIKAY